MGPCRSGPKTTPLRETNARAISRSQVGSRELGLCDISRPPDCLQQETVPFVNLPDWARSIRKARLPSARVGQTLGVVTLDLAWTHWSDHPTLHRRGRRRPALSSWLALMATLSAVRVGDWVIRRGKLNSETEYSRLDLERGARMQTGVRNGSRICERRPQRDPLGPC